MVDDGSGNYTESSSNTWPTNMIYNEELSGCIDVRGNKIDNALSFDSVNNIATIETGSTTYCYLYFDKDTSVYAKLVSDYTNGNGVSLLSETSSDTYPVHYYYGDITNNNVIYVNKCWKMVRTTDTGGVKLIYNGVVTDGGCDNTGKVTRIETSGTEFNSNNSVSLAYVGYMYNVSYSEIQAGVDYNIEYTFGNSVSWDGSNYILNTTTSEAWSSTYSSLCDYHYTCFGISKTCTSVCYIERAESSIAYYITLTGGVNITEALNEMLYAEDVNKYDSTIKIKVDSWYESNIKDLSDSNGKLYSDYLENTIYCNNRAMSNESANDWNLDGTYKFFNYDSLTCENKTDQFTLKESAGGTLGYGNNALDYPLALLSYYEAKLAGARYEVNYEWVGSFTNYLNNSSEYWLLSSNNFLTNAAGWNVEYGDLDFYHLVNSTCGVRPAVSLSKDKRRKWRS